MSQRKTLSKVPLTPRFTTNGPKSNRNKIQVLSGLTVWIISWRLIDIGDTTSLVVFNLFEVLFNYIILFYIYTWILVVKSTLMMSLDVGKSRT
jgi:hypothetical protein